MVKPTIEHVAQAAGVSMKTVSRVINGEPNVRAATRDKVQAAVAALGYSPNQSARSLAGRRSFLVALLYDSPSASYITSIQDGVLPVCRDAGYDLLIHPCNSQAPGAAEGIIDWLGKKNIDGIILTPPLSDLVPLRDLLAHHNIDTVLIGPADKSFEGLVVGSNDQDISFEITRRLISLGHRHIAFVAGDPDHKSVALRQVGFQQAMTEQGLSFDERWLIEGDLTFESGVLAGEALIALDNRPTAIFCSNDDMAAGVINALHKRNIAIPDQVSVVGFDDIALARQLWPALTTVRQPIVEMARSATQLLIDQLKGHELEQRKLIINAQIVERASTAAINHPETE